MAKKKARKMCRECVYLECRKRRGNGAWYCAAAGKITNPNMAACQYWKRANG